MQARDPVEQTASGAPLEEHDDVSVTNSEVESAINHRHSKEALRAPALMEPEFSALSTIGAYIQAAWDGLPGVARLFSKNMQEEFFINLVDK